MVPFLGCCRLHRLEVCQIPMKLWWAIFVNKIQYPVCGHVHKREGTPCPQKKCSNVEDSEYIWHIKIVILLQNCDFSKSYILVHLNMHTKKWGKPVFKWWLKPSFRWPGVGVRVGVYSESGNGKSYINRILDVWIWIDLNIEYIPTKYYIRGGWIIYHIYHQFQYPWSGQK